MTEPARPRPVPLAARLLAAACALVVAAAGCEALARLVYEAPPDPTRAPQILYQTDPELGFVHKPNQTGWLDDGLATINELGLRGPLPVSPKPAGEFRIFAIGDSTTFGWGVNDDGTYTAHLERLLRERYADRPIRVINGGVGAYDLKREAKLLRRFAPRFQPDLVLVGLFWNDLPYEQSTPDGEPQAAPPSVSPAQPAAGSAPHVFRIGNQPSGLNKILRRSRALYVLRQSWLRLMAPTSQATNLVKWEMALLDGRRTAAIDAGWEDIAGTLKEIQAMGEAGGFKVGVVIIPIRAQVEEQHPHAAYQSTVREMATKLGIFVIDPLPYLLRQAEPRRLFIPYDRMHLSSAGNAQIAQAAFDVLRERPEFGVHQE